MAVSICLLEDLEREGPFAPIFRDASDPARPVDWLGWWFRRVDETTARAAPTLYRRERICSHSWSRGVGPRRCPIEDLEPVFEIRSPEPGSALDEQLRREQAKAILDLLIAHKRRHPD